MNLLKFLEKYSMATAFAEEGEWEYAIVLIKENKRKSKKQTKKKNVQKRPRLHL